MQQRGCVPQLSPAHFKPVCNRNQSTAAFELAEDGFIQIVPLGYAVGSDPDGNPVRQFVDARSAELLLQSAHAITGEMLMDQDHFSHDPQRATTALAWADPSTAVLRDDGIYARARLTEQGTKDVLGGNVRFTSPEFDPDMEEIQPGLFRPTRLIGAAFTNRPGFRNAKAVANRQTNPTENKMKVDICKILDLDAATEDAAVLNRVNELKTAAAKLPALETELGTIRNREADAWLEQHKELLPKDEGKLKVVRELFIGNRAAADAMVESFLAVKGESTTTDAVRQQRAERTAVFNRTAAQAPKEGDEAKAKKRATAISNRARQIQKETPGIGWSAAFDQASKEQGED